MKRQRTAWIFLLFFFAALPACADDRQDKQDEKPKQDTILGLWHVQVGGNEENQMVFGPAFSMQIDFGKDGQASFSMLADGQERETETQRYKHDEKKSTLTFYEVDEDGQVADEPDEVIQYDFTDDMLLLIFKEGDREMKLELTRKPEGTARHQKLREEQGDTAGQAMQAARETARSMQSSTQMRGLHQGAVVFANSNRNIYPTSLGEMLPGDYFTAEYVLTPWSETEVPEDIDDWSDKKKVEWVNKHTGYVYLLGGKESRLDSQLVALFEIPRSADQEKVRVAYEDNAVRSMPFAEADKLIKKQTNVSLKEWMKTTSPGTGEYLPEEEKE